MDLDFVYIVTYSCPRCHASLEARASGPPAWLRCPACGRASLPPEQARNVKSDLPFIDDEPMLVGQFSTGGPARPEAIRPRAMAPLPLPVAPKTPTARLLLGSGFFLSTALFVFSMLDSSLGRAGFFALLAIICLAFLTRTKAVRPLGE